MSIALNDGDFKLELGRQVVIIVSGEQGEIIGRAQYLHDENRYFVRYMAGDGRATEVWWNESALTGN